MVQAPCQRQKMRRELPKKGDESCVQYRSTKEVEGRLDLQKTHGVVPEFDRLVELCACDVRNGDWSLRTVQWATRGTESWTHAMQSGHSILDRENLK